VGQGGAGWRTTVGQAGSVQRAGNMAQWGQQGCYGPCSMCELQRAGVGQVRYGKEAHSHCFVHLTLPPSPRCPACRGTASIEVRDCSSGY